MLGVEVGMVYFGIVGRVIVEEMVGYDLIDDLVFKVGVG